MLPVMMPRLLTLLDAHHVLTHQTLQQKSIPSLRGHAIQTVVDALNDGLAETEPMCLVDRFRATLSTMHSTVATLL